MPKGNPTRLEFIRGLKYKLPTNAVVSIGSGCVIHETAVIGRDGFGYEPDENCNLVKFPHFGNVQIGENVHIGAHTCIDRGAIEDTTIGDGTKIDNLVHIAHNCQIGRNVLIVAGAVIGGSTVIGDNTFIGINASIKEHLTIGKNCIIGMGAVVLNNTGDGETWVGNPAKRIK